MAAKVPGLVNRVIQSTGSRNELKRVFKNDSPCNCFTAGTPVQTDAGEKPIEDIEVGDRVLSRNEETGEQAYKEVVQLFQKTSGSIYSIRIAEKVIEATGNHPFWVEGKEWVLAQDLTAGDVLLSSNGNRIPIDEVVMEDRQETVYNFEAAEFHSYFVSVLGVWVHNENLDDCGLGNGGLVFKSDYKDHLINVKNFNRDASKGITGGHNMDNFYSYFRNVEQLDDADFIDRVTPHPTIDGIIQIDYKIPKLDNKGNLTGEHKYFKNPKTVYAPSKISDETIIEWGRAAMQQGIDTGSIIGRKINGIAPNGLKFEGYMDAGGIITNFYPKLD